MARDQQQHPRDTGADYLCWAMVGGLTISVSGLRVTGSSLHRFQAHNRTDSDEGLTIGYTVALQKYNPNSNTWESQNETRVGVSQGVTCEGNDTYSNTELTSQHGIDNRRETSVNGQSGEKWRVEAYTSVTSPFADARETRAEDFSNEVTIP